jgi:hypothetical protein
MLKGRAFFHKRAHAALPPVAKRYFGEKHGQESLAKL